MCVYTRTKTNINAPIHVMTGYRMCLYHRYVVFEHLITIAYLSSPRMPEFPFSSSQLPKPLLLCRSMSHCTTLKIAGGCQGEITQWSSERCRELLLARYDTPSFSCSASASALDISLLRSSLFLFISTAPIVCVNHCHAFYSKCSAQWVS